MLSKLNISKHTEHIHNPTICLSICQYSCEYIKNGSMKKYKRINLQNVITEYTVEYYINLNSQQNPLNVKNSFI